MKPMLTRREWLELRGDVVPVPSPCVSVCQIDRASGWCEGCLRTLDEIADWSVLDADERRAVWALLPGRFDTLQAQRLPLTAQGNSP